MNKLKQTSRALAAIFAVFSMQTAFAIDNKADNVDERDQKPNVSGHTNHGKHHFHFGRHDYDGYGVKVRDFGARKHYKPHHR